MLESLCTCSNTYAKYSQLINPYPANPESVRSLELLQSKILVPTINKFGSDNFKLTYGFCSKDLKKFIKREKSRLCIEIDQHMSCETNRNGNYFCRHRGAACDFQITGSDSRKVISFLRRLDFDSIYYYGSDRPIHISWSEKPRRKIWEFTQQNTPKPYGNYYSV
jgi:hypothetical protein